MTRPPLSCLRPQGPYDSPGDPCGRRFARHHDYGCPIDGSRSPARAIQETPYSPISRPAVKRVCPRKCVGMNERQRHAFNQRSCSCFSDCLSTWWRPRLGSLRACRMRSAASLSHPRGGTRTVSQTAHSVTDSRTARRHALRSKRFRLWPWLGVENRTGGEEAVRPGWSGPRSSGGGVTSSGARLPR